SFAASLGNTCHASDAVHFFGSLTLSGVAPSTLSVNGTGAYGISIWVWVVCAASVRVAGPLFSVVEADCASAADASTHKNRSARTRVIPASSVARAAGRTGSG